MITRKLSIVSLVATAFCLGAAVPARAQSADGPSGRDSYDIGVHTGSMLTRGIRGMTEVTPGWGMRASAPTSMGILEASSFFGRGRGQSYNSGALDFRLDLDLYEVLSAHFLLGGHADYYKPINRDAGFGLGWHYGGGVSQVIGGRLLLRADFKARYSPGSSLEVLIGFTYRMPTGGQ